MQPKPINFELISCTEVKDPETLVEEVSQRLCIARQKFDKYLEYRDKVEAITKEQWTMYKQGKLDYKKKFDEQEKGMMYSFDNQGICVDMRPLLPGERQQRIRTLNKVENGN